MISKKPDSAKRAALPRRLELTARFQKDWERLSRSGGFDMGRLKFDMGRLKQVMLLLVANDGPLGPEWRDHALTGEWLDFRDCHVHGDFLLIFRLRDDQVIFARAGTHADLFR